MVDDGRLQFIGPEALLPGELFQASALRVDECIAGTIRETARALGLLHEQERSRLASPPIS